MRYRSFRHFFLTALAIVLLNVVVPGMVVAQESETVERSRFVQFVERQISTQDRQIRLSGIEGALSSDVRLESITIADREGVWLRIENVHLVWSRSALLRRRLEVELLEADRIAILRTPVPDEGPSEPLERRTFELPEFPLTFSVGEIRVPRIDIAEGVVGDQEYALSLSGAGTLEDGMLDIDLAMERLDGSGQLQLKAAFDDETRVLDVDLLFAEPPNGLVANLLNLEGRPAVSFAIQGSAPLEQFSADISLIAADEELLSGQATISGADAGGLRMVADIGGTLERLVPPIYRELVDDGTRLLLDATRSEDGSISIATAELASGVASLQVSGELASDGVPTELDIAATLGAADGVPVNLPGLGGDMTVGGARLAASLDAAGSWVAESELNNLVARTFSVDRVTITGDGTASKMADPAARSLTYEVTGTANGLQTDDDLETALANSVSLTARGAWQSGAPLSLEELRAESGSTAATFQGRIGETMDGSFSLQTPDIAVFSVLAGRDLGGGMDVSGTGSLSPSQGTFSLSLDGTTQDLEVGSGALDALFAGQTTLGGRVELSNLGLSFDSFTVDNPQISLEANGQQGRGPEPVMITVRVTDVSRVIGEASGSLALEASISGPPEDANVSARVTGEDLQLQRRPFRDAQAIFDGTLTEDGLAGTFTLSGELDGVEVDANAELTSREDGARVLRGIDVTAGETVLDGEIALVPRGLYAGELSLNSPDVSAIAPLALLDASGAVTAKVALTAADDGQVVRIEADASGVTLSEFGGVELGAADVSLNIADTFRTPMASGYVTAEEVSIAGVSFPSLDLRAERAVESTDLMLAVALAGGELNASASLAEAAPGFLVEVDALSINGPGIAANLIDPLEVVIGGGGIEDVNAIMQIGDGRLTVSGEVGPVLVLTADIDRVPLQILNAFQPDLGASGNLAGTLELGGTSNALVAAFDFHGQELTVALLEIVGLDPIALQADGRFADNTLTVDAQAKVAERTVTLEGTIGETLDVTAGIDRFPLDVLDAVAPELELRGAISARLNATGTLAEPEATFELAGEEVTLAYLQRTGLPALDVTVDGRFVGGTAELTEGIIHLGDGQIALRGSIGEILDLNATVTAIPLSLANSVLPNMEVAGAISGSAEVTGLALAPDVTFDLAGSGITTEKLDEAGIPPGELTLEGNYVDGTATLVEGALEITGGRVGLLGDVWPQLDVNVDIADLPLSLAAAMRPELELAGTISGEAQVRGAPLDPQAIFAIEADGITSPALRESGIAAATLRANGNYEEATLTLNEATLVAGDGRIAARGTVGRNLDLSADISDFPVAAVQPEADLSGTLSGTLSATGSAADPVIDFQINGSSIAGFSFGSEPSP